MQDNNFLVIHGWMINKLNLKGNELLCYALVYGFSQDGESEFKGSSQYVADWLNIDKRNALEVLKRLTEKGLLQKTEKYVATNIKVCSYKALGGDETSLGGDETSPNNIDNNITNSSFSKEKEPKRIADATTKETSPSGCVVLDTKTKKPENVVPSNRCSRYIKETNPLPLNVEVEGSKSNKPKLNSNTNVVNWFTDNEVVKQQLFIWLDVLKVEGQRINPTKFYNSIMKKLMGKSDDEILEIIKYSLSITKDGKHHYSGFVIPDKNSTQNNKPRTDINMDKDIENTPGRGVSSGIEF